MKLLAIDPGLSGAWALVQNGAVIRCGDMPVSGAGTRRRVSGGVFASIVRDCAPDLAVIEWVTAMPRGETKMGAASMFRFGAAWGAAIAVIETCGVPFELVVPQVWKRHFNLIGREKEAGRQKALDLCPGITAKLERKMDVGRADAALIGLYGWHRFVKAPEVAAA